MDKTQINILNGLTARRGDTLVLSYDKLLSEAHMNKLNEFFKNSGVKIILLKGVSGVAVLKAGHD